jgi:LicD family
MTCLVHGMEMGPEWLVRVISDAWPSAPPLVLEPTPGTSQCGYELIRAFDMYVRRRKLRYTIGAGTLLGAMRNQPAGLLQWEHDVDVYMPARDAFQLIRWLGTDCSDQRQRGWGNRWCHVLQFPGLLDRSGQPCCGWGFKLYHRHSSACELDVLVLAATHAPFMHGETPLWPIWSLPLARLYHQLAVAWRRLSSADDRGGAYFVIPEDVSRKSLMSDASRWCEMHALDEGKGVPAKPSELAWCGAPLSFFQDEYFAPGELFPTGRVRFHELHVAIPHAPWALLNRTYGHDVAYIARLNEHAGARADLRLAEYRRLLAPAQVRRLQWWRTAS